MQQLHLPAQVPMTLVPTVGASGPEDGPLLLDIHLPDRDIRLHFGNSDVVAAFRRALHAMLADARYLTAGEGVRSRVVSPRDSRPVARQLALF